MWVTIESISYLKISKNFTIENDIFSRSVKENVLVHMTSVPNTTFFYSFELQVYSKYKNTIFDLHDKRQSKN